MQVFSLSFLYSILACKENVNNHLVLNTTDEESESAAEQQPAQGSFLKLLPSRFEVSKPGQS